ncbi:MAG: hypothetical protein ACKPJD_23985, partial [Planctomycetaceae bacterium]
RILPIVKSLTHSFKTCSRNRFPAVCAHGLAGDAAADRWTRRALIASDLLDFLPDAWRQLDQSESERRSS